MACIEKIYSVSAVLGEGKCNAKCAFCAGKTVRNNFTGDDLYWRNFQAAIKLSARYGGWSLSLTSGGEPTCEPEVITEALEKYQECARQGAYFPNVNLFSNGINLGDENFCNRWLPEWKKLGLTNIAISIHSPIKDEQAAVYGVDNYPWLTQIRNNIEGHGIGVRATLLLRKGGIDTASKYHNAITLLSEFGYNNITSWAVGNPDGTRNEFTPSRLGILSIRAWLALNAKLCHGHVWGGGVYDYHGNILRITDYVSKHSPKHDYVRQLVVFPDGLVSYSWIKEGALCLK